MYDTMEDGMGRLKSDNLELVILGRFFSRS